MQKKERKTSKKKAKSKADKTVNANSTTSTQPAKASDTQPKEVERKMSFLERRSQPLPFGARPMFFSGK